MMATYCDPKGIAMQYTNACNFSDLPLVYSTNSSRQSSMGAKMIMLIMVYVTSSYECCNIATWTNLSLCR